MKKQPSKEMRAEQNRIYKQAVKSLDGLFPQWKPVTSDSQWYGEVIAPIKAMLKEVCTVDFSRANMQKVKTPFNAMKENNSHVY